MDRKGRIGLVAALTSMSILIVLLVPVVASYLSVAHIRPTMDGKLLSAARDIEGNIASNEDGFPVVDWEYWQSVNPAVIGWITIPGTGVDSPIVQAPAHDRQYYLDHDVYGKWNWMGCVYLDAGCEADGLDSQNSVLFGHNTGINRALFADLEYYTDPQFALAHKTILVQTPTAKKRLEVRCVAVIDGWDTLKRTNFLSRHDFMSWYTQCYETSSVRLLEPTYTENLFTLCTCSYNYWSNGRTLVFAS